MLTLISDEGAGRYRATPAAEDLAQQLSTELCPYIGGWIDSIKSGFLSFLFVNPKPTRDTCQQQAPLHPDIHRGGDDGLLICPSQDCSYPNAIPHSACPLPPPEPSPTPSHPVSNPLEDSSSHQSPSRHCMFPSPHQSQLPFEHFAHHRKCARLHLLRLSPEKLSQSFSSNSRARVPGSQTYFAKAPAVFPGRTGSRLQGGAIFLGSHCRSKHSPYAAKSD